MPRHLDGMGVEAVEGYRNRIAACADQAAATLGAMRADVMTMLRVGVQVPGDGMNDSALRARRLLVGLSILHVAVWTAIPAMTTTNASLDLIKAAAQGHEWQFGYRGGPPLVPWIVEAIATLAGPRLWPFFLLAQLCVVTAFAALWCLGRRMCSSVEALAAVLVFEAIYFATTPSPDLGSGTFTMPLAAAFGWRLHCGLRDNRLIDWLGVGFILGTGLWASYLMAAFLAPLVLAALILPTRARRWPGAMLAMTIALVMFLPHGAWLMDGGLHQVLSQPKMPHGVSGHRTLFGLISHPMVGGICATLPIWLIGSALLLLPRRGAPVEAAAPVEAFDRRFMLMLAVLPAGVSAMVAGLTGYGVSDLFAGGLWCFAGLAALVLVRPVFSAERMRWLALGWAMIFLLPALSFSMTHTVGLLLSGREMKVHFPGAAVARAVAEGWRQRTGTPLRYVTGSLWLAGNIGFYGEDRPSVFVGADYHSNPWISADALAAAGTVLIWNVERDGEDIPVALRAVFPAATRQPPIVINTLRRRHEIGWAIVR